MKNNAHHSGINQTPFKATFGIENRFGLRSIAIPEEILAKFSDEDDINRYLNSQEKGTRTAAVEEENENDESQQNSHKTKDDEEPSLIDQIEITPLQKVMPKRSKRLNLPNSSNDTPNVNLSNPINNEPLCVTCSGPTTGAHSCRICNKPIHVICGVPEDGQEEGYGCKVICFLCEKKRKIEATRLVAHESLVKQAIKMQKTSDNRHPAASVGDNVIIPIPTYDKSKVSASNVIGVVMAIESDLYKIGCKNGVLKGMYARSYFDICKERLLNVEDVPSSSKEIELRTAANKSSLGGGQGVFHCNCTKKCDNLKCLCFKKNRKCNSRCHTRSSCFNK